MVTHGKGGWTWETVYNLPVYLRNFYMKQLSEHLDAERKAHEGIRKPKPPYQPPGR